MNKDKIDYNVNPCKTCLNKFKNGDCDVNNINDCCYDTLAAFLGEGSVNAVRDTPEAKNCIECLQMGIKDMGRTPCDLRLGPPPIWNQTPHYFPQLLSEHQNAEIAKDMCIQKCSSNYYPNECNINCFTDYGAVEPIQKESFSLSNIDINSPINPELKNIQNQNFIDTSNIKPIGITQDCSTINCSSLLFKDHPCCKKNTLNLPYFLKNFIKDPTKLKVDIQKIYPNLSVNLSNLFPGEELIVIPPVQPSNEQQQSIPLIQSFGLSFLLAILALLLSFLFTFLFSMK